MDDLKEGMICLMHSPEMGSVKVGNPIEHTAREIVKPVLRLPGGTSELVLELLRKDDSKRRCLDISRAREALSRRLRVSVREGPKKPLGWFAEQRVHEAS